MPHPLLMPTFSKQIVRIFEKISENKTSLNGWGKTFGKQIHFKKVERERSAWGRKYLVLKNSNLVEEDIIICRRKL